MGFIVVKTNSLLPGILIHFFNNFFAAGIDALSHNLSPKLYILIFYVATYLLLGIGILCVLKLSKSKNSLISFPERAKCVLPLKKRVAVFCSSGVDDFRFCFVWNLHPFGKPGSFINGTG